MRYFLIISILVISNTVFAQFAPGVGELGCTAIHKDSSAIVDWANTCNIVRGFINIEDTTETFTQEDSTSNHAFFGSDSLAIDTAKGSMDVVSLGDGGIATLSFNFPIYNGDGADFAVFENGMKSQSEPFNYFLELAFVEVSTDGIKYVRFPSISLTQTNTQIGNFDQLDPTNIYNLAGKYETNYGTPFDLQDLADSSGINIDSINFVRIIDVIGDINPQFASYDSEGHIINEPYPTPYWTGGFDLDAVGVMNSLGQNSVKNIDTEKLISVYPNPATSFVKIAINNNNYKIENIEIIDISGRIIKQSKYENRIDISDFRNGIYFINILMDNKLISKKFIKM